MKGLKKIFFVAGLVWFFVSGCGGGGNTETVSPEVTLNDDLANRKIDIEKTKASIRQQMSESITEMYVAPDQKDIFVVANHRFWSKLLDFDVTVEPPVLRNVIGKYDERIVNVIPLKNGRILFQRKTPVWSTIIHLYDYITKKDLVIYNIRLENSEIPEPTIDNVELSFMISGKRIVIGDVAEKISPLKRKIRRDDAKDVVIDENNRLIWQDDKIVTQEMDMTNDIMDICQMIAILSGSEYHWRLPTLQDLHKSFVYYYQDKDVRSYFQNVPEYSRYLVKVDGATNPYATYYLDTSFEGKSITIDFPLEPIKKAYVRCVADY